MVNGKYHMLRVPAELWKLLKNVEARHEWITPSAFARHMLYDTLVKMPMRKEPTKQPVSPDSDFENTDSAGVPYIPDGENTKKDLNKNNLNRVYSISNLVWVNQCNDENLYQETLDFYALCAKKHGKPSSRLKFALGILHSPSESIQFNSAVEEVRKSYLNQEE